MEGADRMLPDDVFRAKRDRAITALGEWRRAFTDCAHIEEENAPSFWRLVVRPHVVGACPFEMIIHTRQTCDLSFGPESYENRPVEDLDRLPAMAEAISAGRILTRTRSSAMTGLALAVETEIRFADGSSWKADRWLITSVKPGAMTRENHWYLPYRR